MPEHRTIGWSPERTWVFVVGTLVWKYPDYFSSFPLENRRDLALVDYFRAQGVPSAQITYLQDRQATTAQITKAFEEQLRAAGKNDLLIVYYCGHGYKEDDGTVSFASYDAGDDNSGWQAETIVPTIEKHFGGSRAMLLVDCCHSGFLADVIARRSKRVAYAVLASSLASELSTGNWTFTEGLLAGLRGQAFVDADADSMITLRELATQIADSMAFAEEQVSVFATTPGFQADLIMAAARTRLDPQIGRRVEVYSENTWYLAQIIDARGREIKVHYYGYEEEDDEWVTIDQVREVKRTNYPAGSAVEVKWKQKWYTAKVLEARAGIHHIQYEGFGPEWNEWVASKRIRPA
jgi:hypothetical protein